MKISYFLFTELFIPREKLENLFSFQRPERLSLAFSALDLSSENFEGFGSYLGVAVLADKYVLEKPVHCFGYFCHIGKVG